MTDVKMTSDIQRFYSLLRGERSERVDIDKDFIGELTDLYSYLDTHATGSMTDVDFNSRQNPDTTSDVSSSLTDVFKEKKLLYLKSALPYYGSKFSLLDKINAVMPSDFNNFYDLFTGGGTVFSNIRALADVKRKSKRAINIKANDILLPIALMHRFFITHPADVVVSQVLEIQVQLFDGVGLLTAYLNEEKLDLSSDAYRETRKTLYRNLIVTLQQAVRELYLISKETAAQTAQHTLTKADRLESIEFFVGAAYYVLLRNSFQNRISTRPITDEASIASFLSGTSGYKEYITTAMLKALKEYCTTLQRNLNVRKSRVTITNESYTDTRPEALRQGDLVYLDPPYLITMASYNRFWTKKDDNELYNYIDSITKCGAKVILSNAITHKGELYNPVLLNWLKSDLEKERPKYETFYFDKKYPGGISTEILTVNFDDFQVADELREQLGMSLLDLEKVRAIESLSPFGVNQRQK